MRYFLSFVFIFRILNCEEILTFKNETFEETSDVKNKSIERNSSFELQRITQPSAQSQHIERALATPPATNSSSTDKGKSDFRPSPHLGTFFEFNKFPVPPAYPEAKHFSAYNLGESLVQWPTEQTWINKPLNRFTTEQSWMTRIRFPTTTTTMIVPTSKDRPYEFYNADKSSTGNTYNVPSKSDTYLSKPVESLPTIDEWNKFVNYEKNKQIIQKNQFDFTAPVAPVPTFGTTAGAGQKSNFDFGAIEKPPTYGMQGNPWKKIIKFLTAFIPIGLLISALTPTVITVQSANGTQSRSRAVDSGQSTKNKLVSSLNYFNSIGCEDRILCELILSASTTQSAEHHVENLLNTFTQEGTAVEKAEEMRRIFEAVKKQNCQPIICKNIKDKT